MTQEQFQKAEGIRENLRMIEQARDFLAANKAEDILLTRMMTFNSRNYLEALAIADEEFKSDVLGALERLNQRMTLSFEAL